MGHKGLMAELTSCVASVSDISVSVPASSDDETDAQANITCIHSRAKSKSRVRPRKLIDMKRTISKFDTLLILNKHLRR